MKRPNLLVRSGLLVFVFFILSFPAIPQSAKESKNADRDAGKAARDAMKAYKDKDYYTALLESAKSFDGSLNKKNLKNIGEIMAPSFNAFVKEKTEIIENHEKSFSKYSGRNSLNSIISVTESYAQLKEINDELRALNAEDLKSFGLDPTLFKDYSNQLSEYKVKSEEYINRFCDTQFEIAQNQLQKEDKKSAFKAYEAFMEIKKFKPDFLEIDRWIIDAKKLATFNIHYIEFGTGYHLKDDKNRDAPISFTEVSQEYFNNSKFEKTPYFVSFTLIKQQNNFHENPSNFQMIEEYCRENKTDGIIFGFYSAPVNSIENWDPLTKEIQSEIGEESNGSSSKQTVKAVRSNYTRSNTSKIKGTMWFYSAASKSFIAQNDPLEAEYIQMQYWTFASGDLRALSERERRSVVTEAPEPVTRYNMDLGAIWSLAEKAVKTSISLSSKL